MIKSFEFTGRTEDDAISAALQELGKTRDEVSVEILERAKSGFLGIGGSPAKIRVSFEEVDSKLTQLHNFLNGLFERMGVEAEIKSNFNEEENTIAVELAGAHVGALIGRRGETLDAIQHLSNYVLNNSGEDRVRVNIDAENYRAKRADALEHLAKKVASKVVKCRRNVTLEPMNAYERHVIHTALQDFNGVTTYSTGTEPNRRVVVSYVRSAAPARESSYRSTPRHSQPTTTTLEAPAPAPDPMIREWH